MQMKERQFYFVYYKSFEMKKIIFLLLITAWLITPYSCTKGIDPVKPPVDTIPAVDSAYLRLLDTMSKIGQIITSDSSLLLRNKPLETIRGFINGKWQLRLIIGGYSGIERHYLEHQFVEYIYNASIGTDSIKYYSDNIVGYTIKRIYWDKKPSNYGDSTFVYWYPDVAVNNEIMIVASRNDTLIIQDNGVNHGNTQLLTKVR
jgi:hypothetical protein